MVHKSHLYYFEIYQKGNCEKNTQFPRVQEKIRPLRHLAQLTIWRGGLGILEIDTQLNSVNIKWIQRSLNPTNALWIDLMMYQLKLILNSDQRLVFFRQKQILRSI